MEETQPQVSWCGIRGLGDVRRHECENAYDLMIARIVQQDLGPLRQACAGNPAARQEEEGAR